MRYKLDIRPLSVNEGYTGRRYKTPAHRAWHRSVLYLLPKLELPEPPYELYLKFGFSSSRSDADNCIKHLTDCLQDRYKFNDKLIKRLVIDTDIISKGKEYIEFELKHYDKMNFAP